MDLIILFGAGFIGVMIVILGIFAIVAKRLSAPSKKLEQRVTNLEQELGTYKK